MRIPAKNMGDQLRAFVLLSVMFAREVLAREVQHELDLVQYAVFACT